MTSLKDKYIATIVLHALGDNKCGKSLHDRC